MSSFFQFTLELNTNTQPLLYYLRGLEKLNKYLKRKGRITPDAITIDTFQIVLKKENTLVNVPVSQLRHITFAQEHNSVHVIIDIMPFTIVTVILCLNSEQITRKVHIRHYDTVFSLNYLKLETGIRTVEPGTVKKRYSWWNS